MVSARSTAARSSTWPSNWISIGAATPTVRPSPMFSSAAQLARGGDGVERALQRRRGAVLPGRGARPGVALPVGRGGPTTVQLRPVVRQRAVDGLALRRHAARRRSKVPFATRDRDRGRRVDARRARRPGRRRTPRRASVAVAATSVDPRVADVTARWSDGDKQSGHDDGEDRPGPPPHDSSPRESPHETAPGRRERTPEPGYAPATERSRRARARAPSSLRTGDRTPSRTSPASLRTSRSGSTTPVAEREHVLAGERRPARPGRMAAAEAGVLDQPRRRQLHPVGVGGPAGQAGHVRGVRRGERPGW